MEIKRYWPFEPLERWAKSHCPVGDDGYCARIADQARNGMESGMPAVRICDVLGLSRQRYDRYRRAGVISDQLADEIATNLGRHPTDFWPDFNDVAE